MDEIEGSTLVQVMLTPGDEVPPQLTNGHLVLQDDLQVTPDPQDMGEGHQTLTRIIEQKSTSGRDRVHNTIIELHTPTDNAPSRDSIVCGSPAGHDIHLPVESDSKLDTPCDVEMRNVKNKATATRPNTLNGSPSAPELCSKYRLMQIYYTLKCRY